MTKDRIPPELQELYQRERNAVAPPPALRMQVLANIADAASLESRQPSANSPQAKPASLRPLASPSIRTMISHLLAACAGATIAVGAMKWRQEKTETAGMGQAESRASANDGGVPVDAAATVAPSLTAIEEPIVARARRHHLPPRARAESDAGIDLPAAEPTAVTATPAPSALQSERALVDEMRVALRERRLRDVERALDEHRLRYPRGVFVEERMRFAFESAVLASDRARAVAALEAFRRAYSIGAHRAAVDRLAQSAGY